MDKKSKNLWILYSYVIASNHRIDVVKALRERPLTPTQIKKETRLNLSHISKMLKNMSQKAIVECINPSQKKGKLFTLTKNGIWIYDQLT